MKILTYYIVYIERKESCPTLCDGVYFISNSDTKSIYTGKTYLKRWVVSHGYSLKVHFFLLLKITLGKPLKKSTQNKNRIQRYECLSTNSIQSAGILIRILFGMYTFSCVQKNESVSEIKSDFLERFNYSHLKLLLSLICTGHILVFTFRKKKMFCWVKIREISW